MIFNAQEEAQLVVELIVTNDDGERISTDDYFNQLWAARDDDDDSISDFEMSYEDEDVGQAASGRDLKEVVRSKLPSQQVDEICTVCLVKYEQDEIVNTLPCKHIFHENCIQTWFESNDTCPLCRARLGQNTDRS